MGRHQRGLVGPTKVDRRIVILRLAHQRMGLKGHWQCSSDREIDLFEKNLADNFGWLAPRTNHRPFYVKNYKLINMLKK